jgi:hypothetical protein
MNANKYPVVQPIEIKNWGRTPKLPDIYTGDNYLIIMGIIAL